MNGNVTTLIHIVPLNVHCNHSFSSQIKHVLRSQNSNLNEENQEK